MNVLFVILAACVVAHSYETKWFFMDEANNIQNFFKNQSDNMKTFFEEQKSRMEKAINNGYEEAVKMKDSVNTYFDTQQKKIASDVNNYVERVKESGRKVADTWSFVPSDDLASRMENPDVVLSVPGIITRNGYTCETHMVMSEGYLLNIHRIPHSKDGVVSPKTVLLQHGIFASSADWILNGPGKGLAYVLSDAGYDVWMSNMRGNQFSREHAWLKSNSKAYWNFSWHDAALYDLPAVIDHIMKVKGEGTKITYIGHSMGTTILFAMLTLRPEYNNILAAGFALAPVVFFTDLKSPIKSLAPLASNVAYMEMLYGSHEFIPKKSALGKISNGCDVENIDAFVCKNIVFYICGYNEKQLNEKLLPVFLSNLGTGTSWKTVVHFAQEVVSGGKFQQFDYGSHNQKMYGSDSPPEYDLSKVTLPLTLFWANNDLLSSETDVKLLSEKLPTKPEIYLVPDPEFNHLDYLWAVDVNTYLNDKILDSLNKVYTKPTVIGFPFKFSFGV
ncbi:lipase 3-like [Epargyreus clarus]|uniref:lipase 3-like n=1 Tax=Epargyreus clarus TaxID=520877 RepID=UPI003C2F1842